jgi:hypothetical protein
MAIRLITAEQVADAVSALGGDTMAIDTLIRDLISDPSPDEYESAKSSVRYAVDHFERLDLSFRGHLVWLSQEEMDYISSQVSSDAAIRAELQADIDSTFSHVASSHGKKSMYLIGNHLFEVCIRSDGMSGYAVEVTDEMNPDYVHQFRDSSQAMEFCLLHARYRAAVAEIFG